ncbi:hypothetical protein [Bacillus wiedmannii]|uniref:hypothetical protein n=1 Tax=Bacillus wiedmannii TaxID=1890302 RepID=UPI000BF95972|nr:hypothetical protein [Bacillus wiedmannii]PEU27837.1 hypothetical protein CN532_13570 [Bacillus wiedmannii]
MINENENVSGNVAPTNERKAKSKLQKILEKKVDEKIKKFVREKSLEVPAYPFRKKQKISCNNEERCVYNQGTNWPKLR